MTTDERSIDAALAELRAWSDALPSYDVDAGATRHASMLADATAGGSEAVVRASARGWWIAGASAAIVLGLGLGVLQRDADVHVVSAGFGDLEVPVRAPVPAPAIDTVLPTPTIAAPTRAAPVRKPSRARAPAMAAMPEDDPTERELAIVRRMRRALGDDPRGVIALADAADRDIGKGMFGEERSALRVFALARIDHADTIAAAAAFLREYPSGPFAARVARLQAREGTSPSVQ